MLPRAGHTALPLAHFRNPTRFPAQTAITPYRERPRAFQNMEAISCVKQMLK
jgi:hypothetical protein